MRCRHCATGIVTRPRRLCRDCYDVPAIRERHPTVMHMGLGQRLGSAPLPDEPTTARPGTEAKLQVMEGRVADRVSLFHPDDAPDYPVCPICGLPVPEDVRAHAECERREYEAGRLAEDESADLDLDDAGDDPRLHLYKRAGHDHGIAF